MARRGENIHKRKDGRWEGRYIKGKTANGSAWGYVYASTYTEVKHKLLQCKAACGRFALSDQNPTFEELSLAWLASVSCGVKASTLAHYRYNLRQYLLPVFGHLRVQKVTQAIMEQGMAQVISPSDGSHRPLGNTLARECLMLLRRLCRYAVHMQLMYPMELEVTLPQQTACKAKPLSRQEQRAVEQFVYCKPTPRKVGLLLSMQLGLRIGEVCGLQWGDFDLQEGILTINRTIMRIDCGDGHTKVVVQSPKTRTSARELPIPEKIVALLRTMRNEASEDVWFLSGTSQKPVEPRCYRKSIHGYLRRAAVHTIHPHMLRHTFATTCLQAGCDIKTLSELLGHANSTVTLKRYVHTDFARMRREITHAFGIETAEQKTIRSQRASATSQESLYVGPSVEQ